MKKIIFISPVPFDAYEFDRIAIQNYIDEGWQVECWSLKYLIKKKERLIDHLRNEANELEKIDEYENSKKIVYSFNNFFELLKHIFKLERNFFVYDQCSLSSKLTTTYYNDIQAFSGNPMALCWSQVRPGCSGRAVRSRVLKKSNQ